MYRVQKTVDKLISNEKLFDKPIFFFNKYSTVTKKKNNSPDFPGLSLPNNAQMRQPRVKINQNDEAITRFIS